MISARVWQAACVGTVRAEVDGSVGTLIIDNPERRNAMDRAMYEAVPVAVAELRDADVRVVVLRGEGDEAFGAGSDISEFPEHRLGDAAASYDHVEHCAWHAVADLDRLVIAAIHGPCMGGGIAMALHADIRVAADDGQFAVPPARLGIAYPPEAVRRLVALVGPGRAKLLLTTARVLDAAAALDMGLVDEVVAKGELVDHVARMAASIARLAPLSVRAAKLTVDALTTDRVPEADAADAVAACYASSDFREGIDAFLQKRRPIFEGR